MTKFTNYEFWPSHGQNSLLDVRRPKVKKPRPGFKMAKSRVLAVGRPKLLDMDIAPFVEGKNSFFMIINIFVNQLHLGNICINNTNGKWQYE